VYSEKTPDDGQRNCSKHVEFYSKNKFEKLVHLVGFIIRTTLFTVKETHIPVYAICGLISRNESSAHDHESFKIK